MLTKKANPNRPARVMPYGPEGVGKSTLGAKADRPVFITPEGGADQLTNAEGNPVDEMVHEEKGQTSSIDTWPKLMRAVDRLLEEDHDFKTLVLDSADWVEGLAHKEIIKGTDKTITTVLGGYGAGYRRAQNMHQELIAKLSELRLKRDMHIVVTAHAHVKDVKDPEAIEDYQASEIKCHELVSALWREWVDALFFIRFKTYVSKSDDDKNLSRARANTDGTRILYAQKQPAFQAKNRYGMPASMEFHTDFWNEFMSYARKSNTQEGEAKELQSEIADLFLKLDEIGFTDERKSKVAENIQEAGDDVSKLKKVRERLQTTLGGKK